MVNNYYCYLSPGVFDIKKWSDIICRHFSDKGKCDNQKKECPWQRESVFGLK